MRIYCVDEVLTTENRGLGCCFTRRVVSFALKKSQGFDWPAHFVRDKVTYQSYSLSLSLSLLWNNLVSYSVIKTSHIFQMPYFKRASPMQTSRRDRILDAPAYVPTVCFRQDRNCLSSME